MTELGADGIQDQMRNGTPASLQSSNSSLDTVVYDLNGRHTLEMDTLRKTVDVHAAELSAQVAQLQVRPPLHAPHVGGFACACKEAGSCSICVQKQAAVTSPCLGISTVPVFLYCM
ncbi:TPA: hypothetical protein ACH3X2_000954 [Trebouxia sp. C0005]